MRATQTRTFNLTSRLTCGSPPLSKEQAVQELEALKYLAESDPMLSLEDLEKPADTKSRPEATASINKSPQKTKRGSKARALPPTLPLRTFTLSAPGDLVAKPTKGKLGKIGVMILGC